MNPESSMKIYGMRESTCTQKVLTVLAEKGHEAELVEVNVLKGEDKTLPEHLARHPFGEIPVLEDDGFLLYESRAIIRYLDQRLPGAPLTPGDLRQRALMEQWISIEQSYFSGPVYDVIRSGPVYNLVWSSPGAIYFPPPPDEALLQKSKRDVARAFEVMDETLSRQPYLAGSMFSLADITHMPYISYLIASGGGELVARGAGVAAWWERVSGRPSWRKVGKVLGQA
ncbi:glutathione S-transferase [Sorangium cellulosum]|uniref:glutathione transferase n=1 Tax=Sorangium cellulosum TaxID=56 RepID=A0A2L0F8A9_SORCE|nr:glutathione S-transferase N-terminal domain-containing protein [Sorangium cellulosum]AUX47815.1 glutathione S-transferase [Sorangium cellulosum]